MRRNAALYLDDIKKTISKIEKYTKGLDKEGFIKDEKTQDAVIRNLEIIGEAAKNIPTNRGNRGTRYLIPLLTSRLLFYNEQ